MAEVKELQQKMAEQERSRDKENVVLREQLTQEAAVAAANATAAATKGNELLLSFIFHSSTCI